MNNHPIDFTLLSKDIKDILYKYVSLQTYTNTKGEKDVEKFFKQMMSEIPYFSKHDDLYGLYPLPGDGLERNVCWSMVKGEGNNTVVLVHHYDVVDVEDYKILKDFAFSPDELKIELKKHYDLLPEDAKKDLNDDTFIFCRGGCDMKAGGSIQYALLKAYSEMDNFHGNVIVIGVPDEENLSSGMRAAAKLLAELKNKFNLNYLMMLNSEPHQRKDFSKGVLSEGTVGKLMPFIYVRGFLSHAGKVFEGLNPTSVLSEIVSNTEVNMEFADVVNGEAAPPPTWLYQKDSKENYDVSMPLFAEGCFSVLTLNQKPDELLEKVEKTCKESFQTVIDRINENYRKFCHKTKQPLKDLPWKCKVINIHDLYNEALRDNGDSFLKAYDERKKQVFSDLKNGNINIIEGNFALVETIYDYVEDISPRVVYGLVPPYYPNISNIYLTDYPEEIIKLGDKLCSYMIEAYDQEYVKEYFYTGICDLSYINIDDPARQRESISGAMPLFGEYYDIPFEEIKEISMAGMNIGPWGKDFHKFTERVNKEDLYEKTPHLLDAAIKELLSL